MPPVTVLIVLAVCALLGVAAIILVVRRRSLSQGVGSFECALRFHPQDRWHNGVARYQEGSIQWYRSLSFSPRPQVEWPRRDFEVASRESIPGGIPELSQTTVYLVRCIIDRKGTIAELAMSTASYHGLSSWSESAPPGAAGAPGEMF